MYSWHLFFVSSAFRSVPFLSFIESIFALNVPLVSLISWRDIWSFSFYCFSLFLCIDHWGSLSYLLLLFFGTLHSNVHILPFLLCFLFSSFHSYFVRPPQTATLLFCFSFSWEWSCSLSPIPVHFSSLIPRIPRADYGSDHELLISRYRLKLKKVGKTTRPFRYDLNQMIIQ